MNDLEFSFEPDPWEIFRMSLTMGDTVSFLISESNQF